MPRDFDRKTEPADFDKLKHTKVEVGLPEIVEPQEAVVISCLPVKENKPNKDEAQNEYVNMGFAVVYSTKIDGEIRQLSVKLTGLRNYGTHLWCSENSGFGMFKKAVDGIEGFDGDVKKVEKLVTGRKCLVKTVVIPAFGEEYKKIIPTKFLEGKVGEEKLVKSDEVDVVM